MTAQFDLVSRPGLGKVTDSFILGEGHSPPSPTVSLDPIWRCPACHDAVRELGARLECLGCGRTFDEVDGIPDFRLELPSWINPAEDTATARELAEANLPLPELVHTVYARRGDWDQGRVARRTREVLDGPERLREDLRGWLEPVICDGPFMDLGCGAGMLMAGAAQLHPGLTAIGIDVSMTWLVVAKRFVAERGGRPVLAAAMAEALPFGDGTVPAVVSLDVIEHVHHPDVYLREIDRVLEAGGRLALSTPNRYSLTAEPHVFVWGVGWLPRRLQRGYVRWRSGKSYEDTALMSSVELARTLRRNMRVRFRILIPTIPADYIAHFAPLKRAVARLFNPMSQWTLLRPLFLWIGPFFRVIGCKHGFQEMVPRGGIEPPTP